uniref:NADH-ubiquinone oxidoreductase chain 2 n=1 Tax=Syllis sp. JYC-2022 TaxID=2928755 RepID=A0A976X815_9ANNE|nr:NADH dehydrogenase subunit 2 [Syllis sp. JYC-2022]
MTKILTPSNMMFLSTLTISTIMMMTSSNWIILWLSMEVNMMSFIPLMLMSSKNQELEGAIKYFLIQTVGSISMLLAVFMYNSLPLNNLSTMLMMASMMIKMGVAPFHIWLPQVMNNMKWIICLIIITWQKLGPMVITSYILTDWSLQILIMLAIMNGMIGALGGINQTQMRPLIAYSSIAHMGWMMSAMILSSTLMLMYFSFYIIISVMTVLPLMKEEKQNTSNFNLSNQVFSKMKMTLGLNLLSMGGMPPFIGFIPKWAVISALILYSPFLVVSLMMTSLLSLFFYLKVTMSNFINTNKSMETKIKMKTLTPMISQMILPFWFIVIT